MEEMHAKYWPHDTQHLMYSHSPGIHIGWSMVIPTKLMAGDSVIMTLSGRCRCPDPHVGDGHDQRPEY